MIKLKSWWKSATVWLGGMTVVVAQIPPELVGMLHPDVKDWVLSLIGLALIYTRIAHTRQAVTVTAAMKPVATDKVIRN